MQQLHIKFFYFLAMVFFINIACKQPKDPKAKVTVLIDSTGNPAIGATVKIFSTGANGGSTAENINKTLVTDGAGVVEFDVDNDVVVQCYASLAFGSSTSKDSLRGQRTLVINRDRKNSVDTVAVRLRK